VCYHGTQYSGSQIQNDIPTIEGELTRAIKIICGDVKKIKSSGRTDSGVHAEGQVIHFDSDTNIEIKQLTIAINTYLPKDICILDIKRVESQFDARFSAKIREYQYLFTNNKIPNYLDKKIVKIPNKIEFDLINECASLFVGKKDFKRFRKTGSNETTTVRQVESLDFRLLTHHNIYNHTELTTYYVASIKANSFLYRMVRNIMGAIFETNRGKYSKSELESFINNKESSFKYAAAPAHGLSLVKVHY